uniref:Uncharacterized protein n=1 Tax=Theropithecus gelada TaxID=9565 RepID=A0A8D2GMD7_THEGE
AGPFQAASVGSRLRGGWAGSGACRGTRVPREIIETDFEKAHRSKKILSLCNAFGGGVFLATCFNALLPAVREKVRAPWVLAAALGTLWPRDSDAFSTLIPSSLEALML